MRVAPHRADGIIDIGALERLKIEIARRGGSGSSTDSGAPSLRGSVVKIVMLNRRRGRARPHTNSEIGIANASAAAASGDNRKPAEAGEGVNALERDPVAAYLAILAAAIARRAPTGCIAASAIDSSALGGPAVGGSDKRRRRNAHRRRKGGSDMKMKPAAYRNDNIAKYKT